MTAPVSTALLPDTTTLGPVELAVTRLDASVRFYTDVLGLTVLARTDDDATLGADAPVLVLRAEPGARPAGRHAGLYHVALLFPSRLELARAAQRIAASRTPIDGASDHGTHEAIYLPDPDGNGLELAADRPREQWPDMRSVAGYAGGPQPLDVHGLLGLAAGQPPAPAAPGLRVGHLHLHVGDIAEGLRFYRDVIGFEEMVDLGSAAFVSAGGYHHHLAFNVWRGEGVPPVPPGVVGLRRWRIDAGPEAVAGVRDRAAARGLTVTEAGDDAIALTDPWGMAVVVAAR